MNSINKEKSFPGAQANQSPSLIKDPSNTKRESNNGSPGLHQLAIGNQLASWFPIQVDANQGPRVVSLMF